MHHAGIVFISGLGNASASKWTVAVDNFGSGFTANVDVFAQCVPNVTVGSPRRRAAAPERVTGRLVKRALRGIARRSRLQQPPARSK